MPIIDKELGRLNKLVIKGQIGESEINQEIPFQSFAAIRASQGRNVKKRKEKRMIVEIPVQQKKIKMEIIKVFTV